MSLESGIKEILDLAGLPKNKEEVLKKAAKIIDEAIAFHPRAWKLMVKNKPFLVVSKKEPYYIEVYKMIRSEEISKGTWTEEDESFYVDALREE